MRRTSPRCGFGFSHSACRGLSLVELLAATLLSTLLMGAVLGLLSTLSRSQRSILENHGIPDRWETRLQELLEWDLQNSRSIVSTPRGFELEGFAGRDFSTGTSIHAPSRITYEIFEDENRSHLIRRETHPELLNLDNSTTSLVALDVGQVVCGVPQPETAIDNAAIPKMVPDGLLPAQVSVTLVSSLDQHLLFSRTVTIR